MRFDFPRMESQDFFVISPHEGLWAKQLPPAGTTIQVISPHEGLWGQRQGHQKKHQGSYFSPWGVMSFFLSAFRPHKLLLFLPMRGYELSAYNTMLFPLLRYFSPWGVMSPLPKCYLPRNYMLFLPMRGYESLAPVYLKRIIIVISPHEGLWDQKGKREGKGRGVISPHEGLWVPISTPLFPHTLRLFLPMRGYEAQTPSE